MKRPALTVALALGTFGVYAAGLARGAEVFSFEFSEEEDREGWIGGFADYPAGEEERHELIADIRVLPSELSQEMALYLAGRNLSDDLFMYYKNHVNGLEPNALYDVSFSIEFATQYEEGSVGIGGSPAHSVWVKAGATAIEPLANQTDEIGILRMNIDKGGQSQAGDDAVLLGDVAKPADGSDAYVLVDRASSVPLRMRTDPNGGAWLFFGTDSGFEGTTALYYTQFSAEFVRIPEPSTLYGTLACALFVCLAWIRRRRSTASSRGAS